MIYPALAGIIIFLAIVAILAAGRLLFKKNWLIGWLRGMTGIVLAACAVLLALSAFDVYSYKQFSKEQSIANLSFTKVASQRYQVSLVDSQGVEAIHELNGDLWQLDARVIKWHNSLAALGLTAGYRLDRLSGRYYSLEKEHTAQRTVHELGNSKSVLDIWRWLKEYGNQLSIIDASYGSATYLPMSDGALFSVTLSSSGLLARPLNERAKLSVASWQ